MEEPILITWLNDFVFCPRSIYFHNLYGEKDSLAYQRKEQVLGTRAHETVDRGTYASKRTVLSGVSVYSETYGLIGKIDIFDVEKGILTERKKNIKTVYDGYVFQLYGQYFALREMGYRVRGLVLHSMDDNKNYPVALPEDDPTTFEKFKETVRAVHEAEDLPYPANTEKCTNCIYEPLCDVSCMEETEKC